MRSFDPIPVPPIRFSLVKKFRVTSGTVAELLLILYFSVDAWKWLAEKLLEQVAADYLAEPAILAIIWLPVVAVFFTKRRPLPADFFLLFLYLLLFVCVTYVVHPDYAYYYAREEYGLWDYVLKPVNGIYLFFLIRLVGNPRRILRGLRVSGYVIYAYSAMRLLVATAKGFWMEEGSYGQEYPSSYNMHYGYTLLLFVCCFLYCAFERGSLRFLLLAGAGIFMILCGGSRGPMLEIAILVALYTLLRFRRSRHKLLYLTGLSGLGLAVAACWRSMLCLLHAWLDAWGLHSRTLEMLLAGTVAQNNGRDVFWDAAFRMIRDNPLGYGAMGARHVLCDIHIVGHPHNYVIELLIEYGVVAAPLILFLMLAASLRIFLRRRDDGRQGVFLIFFANACQLLTSYTYWHSPALWGALAAGVCFFQAEKGKP